jgi:PDZ domain
MSGPRHLWSGDWQLESSARRDELAGGRGVPAEPAEPERPAPAPRPPRRTLRERLRSFPARHGRRIRIGVAAAALTLLIVGAAIAVTSAVGGSSGQTTVAATGSRAWLGIDVTRSPYGGVMVVDVFPGSPAQAAGMEPGDVITRINGHPVVAPSDVTSALAGRHPGDRLKLQFQGSGTTYTASVPLATPPAGYP